jgi:hypothetical protein
LAQIFDAIQDDGDCFALALTNKRCWLIGQPRMKAFICENQNSWAGDRIVCIDDYVQFRDLPSGFLSSEEEEALKKFMGVDEGYPVQYAAGPLQHYCNTDLSSHQPVWSLYNHQQIPYPDRSILCDNIRVTYRQADVLRNITKRQYVRRESFINTMRTYPEEQDTEEMDIGLVVLARIRWLTEEAAYGVHRGVWAGDRFDITSLDALDEKDESGEKVEWTDVTEEVLSEIRNSPGCGGAFQLQLMHLVIHVCDNSSPGC